MTIRTWVSVAAAACIALVGFGAGVWAAGSKKIVVTPPEEVKFSPFDPKDTEGKGPSAALVFGSLKKKVPTGLLIKIPADGRTGPHTHTSDDHGVIVKGTMHNFAPGDEGKGIGPGGTWIQPGKVVHDNHCEPGSECLVFVYFAKGFDFKPVKAKTAAK